VKAVVAARPDRQLTETSRLLVLDLLVLAGFQRLQRPGPPAPLRRLHGRRAHRRHGAADIGRVHVESYKAWLAGRPGRKGRPTPNTIRANSCGRHTSSKPNDVLLTGATAVDTLLSAASPAAASFQSTGAVRPDRRKRSRFRRDRSRWPRADVRHIRL
jgi:hypothetical protein